MALWANIVDNYSFSVFADLDNFNVLIDVYLRSNYEKAKTLSQQAFDEWYENDDPERTLLEEIVKKLDDNNIGHKVYAESFDEEYMNDLEEECENLSEENRQLKEKIKYLENLIKKGD